MKSSQVTAEFDWPHENNQTFVYGIKFKGKGKRKMYVICYLGGIFVSFLFRRFLLP